MFHDKAKRTQQGNLLVKEVQNDEEGKRERREEGEESGRKWEEKEELNQSFPLDKHKSSSQSNPLSVRFRSMSIHLSFFILL